LSAEGRRLAGWRPSSGFSYGMSGRTCSRRALMGTTPTARAPESLKYGCGARRGRRYQPAAPSHTRLLHGRIGKCQEQPLACRSSEASPQRGRDRVRPSQLNASQSTAGSDLTQRFQQRKYAVEDVARGLSVSVPQTSRLDTGARGYRVKDAKRLRARHGWRSTTMTRQLVLASETRAKRGRK
jgi:hypothetical protein